MAATTLEETASYLRKSMQRWADDGGFFAGICADGQLVGTMSVHIDTNNCAASLGYWLAAEFEGRGLVSRSVLAVTDWLVRARGIERVEIRAEPENVRSRAVAERCGFTLEGTLRRSDRMKGRFRDFCVYAMLREEWLAPNRALPVNP